MLQKQLTKDPLAEKKHEVLPQLIHKYHNRVLCLLTTECHAHCSFCFRRNLHQTQNKKNPINLETIIQYVKKNPSINEFIFSGGEPLLEGQLLEQAVFELEKIKHLKVLRIHSRLPIINPQIMPWKNLEKIAQTSHNPLYFVIHVNRYEELTQANVKKTIEKLRALGFILLSHTVFLKNINDNLNALRKLFNKLVELGVKPYYIFHCDNMQHTKQFVVDLEKERALMSQLRQVVSGLAFPLHVIDSENGKIPIPNNSWQCRLNYFTDFDGKKISAI